MDNQPIAPTDEAQLAAVPNDNEIKEIQATELPEKECIECKTTRLCLYTLMQADEQTYLCEIGCVKLFQKASAKIYTLVVRKVNISHVPDSIQQCAKCTESKTCKFRIRKKDDEAFEYFCDEKCLEEFIGRNTEKYIVNRKRYVIDEINETAEPQKCLQCSETIACRYMFKLDDDCIYLCKDDCLNLLISEQPDRFRVKRRMVRVRDLPRRGGGSATTVSEKDAEPEPPVKIVARTEAEAEAARQDREHSFIRRCSQCFSLIVPDKSRFLQWEVMDFCNEICLGSYQGVIGATCTMCRKSVNVASLGKYCVRFGYEIRQFCRAMCLDEFKKGLKLCSFCQKDISKDAEGFLASVGGQFKDFCSQHCMKRYDEMCNPKKRLMTGICSVCNNVDEIRVEIIVDGREQAFCSNPCFSAFKFVNNIFSGECLHYI